MRRLIEQGICSVNHLRRRLGIGDVRAELYRSLSRALVVYSVGTVYVLRLGNRFRPSFRLSIVHRIGLLAGHVIVVDSQLRVDMHW